MLEHENQTELNALNDLSALTAIGVAGDFYLLKSF